MKKKKDKRSEFYSFIPLNAKKILDIGCSDGGWVEKYSNNNLEIVGIEKNKDLCQRAQKRLRQAYNADIENFVLPYPEGYFDCIIYGDIIEHLIDPYNLLRYYKRYLKKDGYVIASIPNVRYYKIILRLILNGVWDYMENGGLLDKTHLRFFTLLNIRELFINAGFKIVEIKRNIVSASGFRFLNFLCFNKLKEFLVYQYYIKAEKQENEENLYSTRRKVIQF